MRINMPVTDQEVIMDKNSILVTRTNLKGVITYANDAFVEISGFSRDELIGKNHNIVRHPDMPEAIFEDLWQCNKSSRPWSGVIKNRTKEGGFYWVDSNVTPIFKKGQLDEYLSVRYAPSIEQISQTEDYYKKIENQKTQVRPKGFALMLKNIREMKMVYKGWAALIGFMLPTWFLIYSLYLSGNYQFLSIVAIIFILATMLSAHILKLFENTLESTIDVCYSMASGYYRNQIDLDRTDQIGDFSRALYSMQVKLNFDLAYEKERGETSARIKQALDQVTGNVMMVDVNLDIIYMNNSAINLFKRNEGEFRQDLPDFNADTLIGTNIDVFHRDPAHQRAILEGLSKTLEVEFLIGGRTMLMNATPVFDKGVRLGTAVEWIDRTQEIRIQNEIDLVVTNVKKGKLDTRLNLDDKEGFFAQLSEGMNDLTEVVEQVINEIAYVMSGIAEGDLTRSINKDYQGTFAICKDDINQSLKKLSSVFGEILDSSEFIDHSSQEISSGNTHLSRRAEKQASNLEETAASMEELTGTIKNNAENAQQADHVATVAKNLAENGGEIVNSAIHAMQDINESSNKISDIIAVIDEIAFQINLLALNASVEAARAGEQGRGFSVVATEVRNLAQRSAKAAKESKELIENSFQKTKSGSELVNETGEALNEIVAGVKKVGGIVSLIASASIEQTQGIEQVNHAILQLDEITQQNAALAEQASAASMAMSDQSRNMTKLLSFFKVSDQSFNKSLDKKMIMTSLLDQEESGHEEIQKLPPSNSNFLMDDDWEEF